MSGTLLFHDGYREVLTLRDGRRVRIRTVLPSDKTRLLTGFQRLSDESRRSRFLAPKKRLTPEDLAYLTEFDGVDHYALGAVELRDNGMEGAGAAIGRFRRSDEDPKRADVAIVVLDTWQGAGLGRLLLVRLMAAACERGIQTFNADFFSENRAVRRLLESVCPAMSVRASEPGVFSADLPLDSTHSRTDGS